MSKPIEATPTLSGKDAEDFINEIVRPRFNEKEKALFKELIKLEETTK